MKLLKDISWAEGNNGYRLFKKSESEIMLAANINTGHQQISFQVMVVNSDGQVIAHIPFKSASVQKGSIEINGVSEPMEDAYDNIVEDAIEVNSPVILKLLSSWEFGKEGDWQKLSDIVSIPK